MKPSCQQMSCQKGRVRYNGARAILSARWRQMRLLKPKREAVCTCAVRCSSWGGCVPEGLAAEVMVEAVTAAVEKVEAGLVAAAKVGGLVEDLEAEGLEVDWAAAEM